MAYANHIKGNNYITIIFDDREPITVLSDNYHFVPLRAALDQHRFDLVPKLADKALAVSESTEGKFNVKNGVINIDGEPLPRVLSDRLLNFIKLGLDTKVLENFWDNLKENPSKDSKQDLYLFLEKNHIPITEDGCFVGYKKVNNDFTDHHTSKIDQSPGKVVSMPRNKVDPNRHNVCSVGLHIADFSYADKAMGPGKILKVKVNPKDVVTVPVDHNARKMRVCKFQSLEEYLNKEEIKEQMIDEPESAKKVKNRVTKGKFKPLQLIPDKEGRLRIPGVAIRQLGIGVGRNIQAFIKSSRSKNIKIAKSTNEKPFEARKYKVAEDNSIRLPASMLEGAKIGGFEEYWLRKIDDELEVRAK